MLKLSDIAGMFAGSRSAGDARGRRELALKLVFWPLALLAVLALILQLGAWRRDYKIAGPFPPEVDATRHSFILNVPEDTRPKWWMEKLVGDDREHPYQSVLQLRIADRNMGPAHATHETIREGKTRAFSHWGKVLIFPLPPGVKNGPETIASLRYSVRPPPWVTFVLTVLSAALGWRLYEQTLRSLARRYTERPIAAALAAPYLILVGLCGVALLASAIYLLTSLVALAQGWALPTTALIRWSPIAQWAVRNEPYLGHLLLTLAGFGAAVTWLASLNEKHQRLVESYEGSLRRFLAWSGFPIMASAFILCISAMWAGILRAGDPNSANIGGLIPFSDAANYLTAAFDQTNTGVWDALALRRPLAAAFRSDLLAVANYSLQTMLILQACMVAAAACYAAHAVAVWRGTWAGVAFFALTYIYSRYFVPTTLTEPFGLFWALLSVPFLIEAFVSGSVRPALIAFAITVVALMTRMGSMFTIPALMLWLVWQFGQTFVSKARILGAAVGIVLAVIGLNSLLQKAYGSGPSDTTGNFAYVLCGLSMGTGWVGCLDKVSPRPAPEAQRVNELYAVAWKNIQANPDVLLGRIADNAEEFTAKFPDVLWRGYGVAITEPDWLLREALVPVGLLGLLFIGFRRARANEFAFWALLWASIVASAAIIYADDGSRALAASIPLMALFLSMGLTNPVLAPAGQLPRRQPLRHATAGLLAAAVLFVAGPWLAHRFSPAPALREAAQVKSTNEFLVFGGRRISGFLVVADDQPLRGEVPSVHLSDFETIFQQSNVGIYQTLLDPPPPLPFGFVFAPRLDLGSSLYQYIVPAEVFERRDVRAWRFTLERWGVSRGNNSDYWFRVTRAEPIP